MVEKAIPLNEKGSTFANKAQMGSFDAKWCLSIIGIRVLAVSTCTFVYRAEG